MGVDRVTLAAEQLRGSGTVAERDAIARRGWDRFVLGVDEALPQPYSACCRWESVESRTAWDTVT